MEKLLQQLLAGQARQNLILRDLVDRLTPSAWQQSNPYLAASCREAAETLTKVYNAHLQNLADEIVRQSETLIDSDLVRNEFLDKCGQHTAFLNSLLTMFRQLGNR